MIFWVLIQLVPMIFFRVDAEKDTQDFIFIDEVPVEAWCSVPSEKD